jgi:hypothetical protein
MAIPQDCLSGIYINEMADSNPEVLHAGFQRLLGKSNFQGLMPGQKI